MSLRLHQDDPSDAIEATFFRVQRERMTDVPVMNPSLSVQAVGFQRWRGQWLGMIVTPWCMSLLLLPGSSDSWTSTNGNGRRFVEFPAGKFAFLGSFESDLGEFQSCSVFSPMNRFEDQSQAVMTAQAFLLGLLAPTSPAGPGPARDSTPEDTISVSRRRFFSMR